ncbi:hypothetical protein RhiLY_07669 [Ceratobasidium sp. AG-Ba]|nr:hypothetical protein RhiLY_07669 [Ceratobasidium sp. AG-Ba]
MEQPPSYRDIRTPIHEHDGRPTTPTPDPPPTAFPERPTSLLESALIGASGVRIPLSREARAHYDSQVIHQLKSYGALTRVNTTYPTSSPLRTQTFHPHQFYQSAISQLDRLFEVLSSNSLPSTTTLRTIKLRIRLPAPDADYVREARQNGLVQGRAVIKRAFRFWMQHVNNDKAEEALFEAVDSVAGRIIIEGFIILEECNVILMWKRRCIDTRRANAQQWPIYMDNVKPGTPSHFALTLAPLMENLPSYHDIDTLTTADDSSRVTLTPSNATPPHSGSLPPVLSHVIGGSGARIPLSNEARADYDRNVVQRLKSYGQLETINIAFPAGSPLR